MSQNPRNFRSGTVVSNDHETPRTTIGLRIPGYGAAEVFIDFTEELRHTETNPMCAIH